MTLRHLIVLLTLCAVGCGEGAADPALERGNTLAVLYAGSSEWMFSPNHDDSPKFLIFEPLVTRAGGSCSEIVGGLAESWSPNADYTEWTVGLRPGVRWHDGRPVTAYDVAQSLETWKHPDVGWYSGAPVQEWAVLDSLTFRVRLTRPNDWPQDTWDVIHPGHILEGLDPADFFEWEFWTRPVGNGPFRFVRAVPETFVELEANDDYYLGRPSIDGLIIQFQTSGGNGLVELQAGNVDILQVEPLDVVAFARDPRFRHYYQLQASSNWLVWNTSHPILSDLSVRRALAHASDREALAAVLGLPPGLPVTDGLPGPCVHEGGELVPEYAFDVERAEALLAEAGWIDVDGDGIRDRSGVPLAFTLTVDARWQRAAVFLQEQWRRVGVAVDLVVFDGSIVHQRFGEGDFDAIMTPTSQAPRRVVMRDSPIPLLDPELADALTAVDEELDPQRKNALALEAGRRYRELAPALFLQFRVSALVAHRRVQGLGEPGSVIPTQGYRHPFGDLTKIRLEPPS